MLSYRIMRPGTASSICTSFIGYAMDLYFGMKGRVPGSMASVLALGITIVATFTGG